MNRYENDMKILLIANPNSLYIKNYIKYVLNDDTYKIYLTRAEDVDEELEEFYQFHGVTMLDLYRKTGLLKTIPRLSTIVSFRENLKTLVRPLHLDVIQIHYMGNPNLMRFSYKLLGKCCKKLVLTYWGSDILDIHAQQAKKFTGLLKEAYKIVVSTEKMKEAFHRYYGDRFDDKLAAAFFGLPFVDRYTEMDQGTRDKMQSPVPLPDDRIIIALGYNGSTRQQHQNMIEALGNLPDNIRDRCYFAVQMTYGVTEIGYPDKIRRLLREKKMSGVVFEHFLSVDESIAFKQKVDIFIHAQTTDALSSSMLEYLFIGSKVINGSWLGYKELKEIGIQFYEFSSFEELPAVLERVIHQEQNDHNYDIIRQNHSWKSKKKDWIRLFE